MRHLRFFPLLATAVVAALSLPIHQDARAQAADMWDSGVTAPHFGARVSVDISSVTGSVNQHPIVTPSGYVLAPNVINNGAGFTVGGVYNIPLWRNLYFEPGLGVYYNTVGLSGTAWQEDRVPAPGEVAFGVDGSIRQWGFRIPLVFGYHVDLADNMKVALFTGPQMNIGLSSKMITNLHRVLDGWGLGIHQDMYGNGLRRVDAQWVIGASYNYGPWQVGVSGGIGMSSLLTGNQFHGIAARRNTFSVSLGYDF